VVAEEAQYVLQTYGRPADVVFVKGQGSKLYDMAGKEYLDMAAGEETVEVAGRVGSSS
jgi:acetylornithine/succinyldiaminopimelate/putrescine aminotransferase